VRSRRTLGVDLELAEALKEIARSRGMSLVSYLRKLFEEVIEVERLGYFAPSVLRDKRIELVLSKLGFIYLPLDLLNNPQTPEAVEALGERVGSTLRELGIDSYEVIERITLGNGLGIVKEDSLILIPSSGPKETVRRFLVGLARGSSLNISTSGDLVIIRAYRYP